MTNQAVRGSDETVDVIKSSPRYLSTKERLELSLANAKNEIMSIATKLANERVSKGKKDKLRFRKKILRDTVLPRIEKRFSEISGHVCC